MTEAWGRGIKKIINANLKAGKPKPMFETIGYGLRVTFYSDLKATEKVTANAGVNKLYYNGAYNNSLTAVVYCTQEGKTSSVIN